MPRRSVRYEVDGEIYTGLAAAKKAALKEATRTDSTVSICDAESGVEIMEARPKRYWRDFPRFASNPSKSLTLRNMASVTIKRLPGGAVAVTGRKLGGSGRANPAESPVSGYYVAVQREPYGKKYDLAGNPYRTKAEAIAAGPRLAKGRTFVVVPNTNTQWKLEAEAVRRAVYHS
jgi:hypothetical protein